MDARKYLGRLNELLIEWSGRVWLVACDRRGRIYARFGPDLLEATTPEEALEIWPVILTSWGWC